MPKTAKLLIAGLYFSLLLAALELVLFHLRLANPLFFVPYLAVLFVLCQLSVRMIRRGRAAEPGRGEAAKDFHSMVLRFKVATVPFFLLNFAFWLLLTIGTFVSGEYIFILPILFAVLFSYLVMLASSAYAISAIGALYRRGVITSWQHSKYVYSQLFFVSDVVGWYLIRPKLNALTDVTRTDAP
ncbi:MAG: hypothetical protein LBT36_04320 [Oscillospiraceae bacterium]|jgi:hypothetical protein|nr:hypothetical protein [Oscillospiraceae bacterium]